MTQYRGKSIGTKWSLSRTAEKTQNWNNFPVVQDFQILFQIYGQTLMANTQSNFGGYLIVKTTFTVGSKKIYPQHHSRSDVAKSILLATSGHFLVDRKMGKRE